MAGLGSGAIYGGVFIVTSYVTSARQTDKAELSVVGVLWSSVAAVVGGMTNTRRVRVLQERPELAVLRPADRAVAIVASRRGPIPSNWAIRSAATKLAVDNATLSYRQRWWLPAAVVVGGVPAVIVQVTHPSVVSAVYLVALLMLAVSGLTSRRRVDRRRDLLTGSPGF